MTKSLTEQWKDGELPNGNYYTICLQGWSNTAYTFPCIVYCERNCFSANVVEVLAPVPSYEEVKHWDECANKIMDEVEKLKEQLNEANEVIKWYDGLENILIGWEICTGQPKGTAKKYLEKWGVK